RLGADAFLITPYRLDRHAVDLADLVVIRGGAAEKGKTPSRAARIHRAIYARHPTIGAIVNANPVNATAFCVTNAALDARTIPESYILLRDPARVPFGVPFRDGAELAGYVSTEQPIALIENDGVLVCGTNILR